MRKLFLTFLALIVQLCAWAFEGEYHKYTISPSTGELSRTDDGTSNWKDKWVSTDEVDNGTEVLILTANSFNFQASGGALDVRSGTGKTSTYTLTVPNDYLIASYKFTFRLVSTGNIKVYTDKEYTAAYTNQTISKVYPNSSTASFRTYGDNEGILVTGFEVEVVRVGSDIAEIANSVCTIMSEARSAYNSIIYGDNLVNDANQLSSPYTSSKEGSISGLLTDDGHWHSDYSKGSVSKDVHYLQVSLAGIESNKDYLSVILARRTNADNDHPTKLRAMGYTQDNANLGFADGKDLGLLTFPYTGKGTIAQSNETFDATGYPYIRFYWEESNGSYQRGYWHCRKLEIKQDKGFRRDFVNSDNAYYLYWQMRTVESADLNKLVVELEGGSVINHLNTLAEYTSSFNNDQLDETSPRYNITWNLTDKKGHVLKTEKLRNCLKGKEYETSLSIGSDFGITLTGNTSITLTTNADVTETIGYTVPDGFPEFASCLDYISAAKWYNINVRQKYVTYDAASNKFSDDATAAPDAGNKNGWFAFVGDPDTGFKIFNYEGACAFGSDNVSTNTKIKGVREAEAATYLFEKQTNDTWQVRDVRGANAFLNQQSPNLGIWDNNARPDIGNKFTITAIENVEAYSYVTNIITASDAEGANPISGEDSRRFYLTDESLAEEITPSHPYINTATSPNPSSLTSGTCTITYTATHTRPIKEGKWYLVANRNQTMYMQYMPASGNVTEGIWLGAAKDWYESKNVWYFEHKDNTLDDYYICNLSNSKYVKVNGNSVLTFTENKSQATAFSIYDPGSDGQIRFVLSRQLGGTQAQQFVVGSHVKDNNYPNNVNTSNNNRMCVWNTTSFDDQGNNFWIEDVEEGIKNALSTVDNEDETATDVKYVGAFSGTSQERESISSAYDEYKASKTADNFNSLLSLSKDKFVGIDPNKYYQFVAKESVGNTGRVMYATPCCTTTGGGLDFERNIKIGNDGTTASIPASAFKLQEVDGGYKIEHVNSKYWIAQLGGINDMGNPDLPISNDNAGIYLIENVTGQTSTIWSLRDKDANTKYIHSGYEGDGNNILVRTQAPTANEGCRWAIREITQVPVSVSRVKWATLCLPMPVTIPSDADLEVYYISGITSDGILTLTKIGGGTTVDKETPMLLYSSAEIETLKTYNFAVSTETGTLDTSSNKLSGSTARRKGFSTTTSEYYGLAEKNDVVGFYPSTSEIIAANKAYLLNSQIPSGVQAGARALLFSTDGDTETGITATEATTPDLQGTIYDMYGRQVKKMQRGGIYIINGTKVIVK